MPLAKITFAGPATPAQIDAASAAVHGALVEAIKIPSDDFFQIITTGGANTQVRFDPSYLGQARDARLVIVEITLALGRTVELKQALFASIAVRLAAALSIPPSDVFVTLYEVAKENWSFGGGIAQYAGTEWPPKVAAS